MKSSTLTRKHASRPSARRGRHLDDAFVDFFAGGGGASVGIERATGRPVTTAINHDANAIRMHEANHPATRHVREDVWRADLIDAAAGRRCGGAWFSPDCRHFSRAKGKTPVKKNIRGLAWVVVKAAKALRPKRIWLENVREFEDWGPLEHVRGTLPSPHEILTTTLTGRDLAKFKRGFKYDKHGEPVMMPIKGREGETFRRFVRELRGLGYRVEWRVLNAADYGAPTHRRRLFMVARCDGKPIRWPEPSHGPKGSKPYRTAAECIDFSLPCPSVLLTKRQAADFARATGIRCKRPLAKKTRWRVAMGIKRFVLDNPKPFVVRVNHGGNEFRGQTIDAPLATVTGRHGYGLVSAVTVGTGGAAYSAKPKPVDAPGGAVLPNDRRAVAAAHVVKFRGDCTGTPADAPLPTVTSGAGAARPAGAAHAMGVGVATLVQMGYGERRGQAARVPHLDKPLGAVVGTKKHAVSIANVVRLCQNGSSGQNVADVRKPLTTITSKKEHCLVAASVAKHYGGVVGHGVDRPLGTVTATDHHSLLAATVVRFNYDDHGVPIDAPAPATTAQGGFVLTEQELRRAKALAKWMRRQIGREMDGHVLTVRDGDETFELVVARVEGELHVVTDVGLRMFTPRELARCQGFPEDYVLTGSQASQVARIGNSVPPDAAEALVKANWN